jgi:tetratricopeptide (TPR) repeat protein
VPATGRGTADTGPERRATSYDQLVEDADRLLEHGKSARADKLYAQALAARPEGVEALTGSAYVLLDRQRHFKAIETFRRALAIQPTFGPALFGIAESYRARGDMLQALAAYRQYLAVTPTGTDAPAARRQIKELESSGSATSDGERSSADVPSVDTN